SNLVLDTSRAAMHASGESLSSFARVQLLPVWQRSSVSLTLTTKADELPGAGLLIDHGAAIRTDPGAAVTLNSNSALDVYGTVSPPAGAITISQKSQQLTPSALHVGSGAQLLSRGFFMPAPNRLLLQQGQVLRGGQITLNGAGDVIVDAGALLDVSA